MSDNEGHSGSTEAVQEAVTHGESDAQMSIVKKKRAQLRGKITRSINRIKKFIDQGAEMRKRIEKEMIQVRKDFELARECHAEMYEYVDESLTSAMDNWEDILTNDIYDIEENVEDFLQSLSVSQHADAMSPANKQNSEQPSSDIEAAGDSMQPSHETLEEAPLQETEVGENVETSQSVNSNDTPHSNVDKGKNLVHNSKENEVKTPDAPRPARTKVGYDVSSLQSFDSWIDNLIEFKETVLPIEVSQMSVAQALYKLEANKDIPSIKLIKYDGNPLTYVEFIERFKLHIHDKPHLSDDVRMVQLKMHVVGNAERAISGLSSQGTMYVTALKTLKEQFGQPNVIARAYISKLIDKRKLQGNDRHALQALSFDVVNCVATLKQINHLRDINATDNLRRIVKRLPDHLIDKWKGVASDLREKGETPSLEHISHFLRRRVKAEFDPDFGDIQKSEFRRPMHEKKGIHSNQRDFKKPLKCYMCSEEHRVVECPNFANSSTEEKIQHAKDQRLCFSCLNRGHVTKDCKSKERCGVNGCSRFHHRLLHTDPPNPTPRLSSATSALDKDSIMPVVRVRFKSANGRIREGNVLVDSGAGTTVIRKSFAKALGLQGTKERIDIAVVGGERITQSDSRRVKFWISPLHGNVSYPVEAHEIDHTIINIPALDRTWLKSFNHLSDIEFPHRAGPVDLILGVQYSHLHAESEVRQGLPFQPVGKRTKLGWHVIGPDNMKGSTVSCVNFARKIDLEKFYDFETVGIRAPDCSCPEETMSRDGKKAMALFESSCEKLNGRFVIGLPWKKDPAQLPNNYSLARRRLESLERSLAKSPSKAKIYDDAIREYERNGWARRLTDAEIKSTNGPVYYLPHHGIYRPEKKSTPLRVVFDPACLFQGVSLNSFLHKGPCLIGSLLGVLLRFREEPIAFAGDISKMFLQILLPERDCQVHRFLWRNMETSREPSIYTLLRVTFGDKPSPDMASFVMLKIAEENRESTPEASKIIERDRYVDDLIHSCSSTQDAIQRIADVERILNTGGFKIKEWHCSSKQLQEQVSEIKRTTSIPDPDPISINAASKSRERLPVMNEVNLDREQGVKTLGVSWNPSTDTINFEVKLSKTELYTKRKILSNISRLFDPLGLASVVTIRARVALQEIWKMKKFSWDDPLPREMQQLWQKLFTEIEELRTVQFPRCLQPESPLGSAELHVFADASILAYGAIAYLVWPSSNGKEVRLISAKARVAPLRQTTIPRLELMAALLASRLAKTIYDEFKSKPSKVILWSDSMIVLTWLRSESTLLKSFVGVRVAEIQATWEPATWRYVPTKLNPADDLSRGISVKEINGRWMNGPSFLRESPDDWPTEVSEALPEVPEFKVSKPVFALQPTTSTIIDPSRFSKWQRLCRVTAYCLRFVNNAKSLDRVHGPLLPEEIESAERYWVTSAQTQLGNWKERYKDLSPFEKDGIVRVGGRLKHSPLSYDENHPMLLPTDHVISKLVVKDAHNRTFHAGRERTLCETRRKFWITRGRNLVRKIVRECVTCRRLRQYPYTTLMADLPPERLKPFSPPFSVTGVDLFGPFFLKYGRNKKTKGWGALFTCATVRAIHLEIVQDLSTEAFLHALRRFAAHHGWPSTIISDNGTSFVGAERELKKLLQEGKGEIEDFAVVHKVRWRFNTPLSPHQGGMFETMIKQTKSALRVAVGQQVLSWNEMSTMFAEVECLINSRPLGYPSNDANDLQPLTPNHLILGRATADVPQGPFREVRGSRKRFDYVQALVEQFWNRFQREYLQTLMRRAKWRSKERQFKVGDIVLLVDANVVRGKWNLARVIEVYPGRDGVVRNVKLRTKSGEYKRSVQKCCPILEEDSS